jgi:integrase
MGSSKERIEECLEELEFTGRLAPSSAEIYAIHLNRYLLPELDKLGVSIEDMSWSQFIKYLKLKGWGKKVGRQAQCAIRAFIRWEENIYPPTPPPDHPVFANPLIIGKSKDGRTFLIEETDELRAVYRTNCATGIRNLAALLLSFHGGLRSVELCGLEVDDLLWDERKIRIRNGKGAKETEYAPFDDEETRATVRMWLDMFRDDHTNELSGDALFVSVKGHRPGLPMTTAGWRSICRKWSRRAGIEHFSPHSLRRGFAYHYAIVVGLPNELVRKAGRWSDHRSFARYTVGADLDAFLGFSMNGNGHHD